MKHLVLVAALLVAGCASHHAAVPHPSPMVKSITPYPVKTLDFDRMWNLDDSINVDYNGVLQVHLKVDAKRQRITCAP